MKFDTSRYLFEIDYSTKIMQSLRLKLLSQIVLDEQKGDKNWVVLKFSIKENCSKELQIVFLPFVMITFVTWYKWKHIAEKSR